MSYPNYTKAERIVDGIVHVIGVGFALVAVFVFFARGTNNMPTGVFWASVLYAITMVLMLSASAAYHLAAHTSARPLLRRLDHAAIYVKIAGTLTPLGVLLGTMTAYAVLSLIWLLALRGAAQKLLAARGQMTTGWVPQVALGWFGICLMIPLWPHLPDMSIKLILSGGLIYTGAVVFYCWESLKYCNAIWHVCVLVATVCCFLGISSALVWAPIAQIEGISVSFSS